MRIRELLKAMLHGYFVITTGVTISMYVSCLLFSPNASFSPVDIGGILLAALISDLSFFVFCSRKDLSKCQMLLRFSIHIPVIVAVLLCFADAWNWVNVKSPIQVVVFVLLVLGVYAGALAVTFYRDRKTAEQLNDQLKKRYHS